MARLYFLSNTNSDLTGAFHNKFLYPNNNSIATTLSTTTTGAGDIDSTRTVFAFTPPLNPSQSGSLIGNYTVNVDVTTANNNHFLSVLLNRVDSAGILQSASTVSAENNITTTGIKTFTFTNLDLGTWTSGDRLRVDCRFRNSAMNNQTSAIGVNDPDCNIITPFTVRGFVVT